MRYLKYAPLMFILTPFLFAGCTSMLLVRSAWSGNKIVVDGTDKDWGDTMFYIPSAQLTVGVRNDAKYLYLVLKTTDRRQAFQIRGLGLTVWFDRSGGAGEKFGIHFPIGHSTRPGFMQNTGGQSDNQQENASFVMRNPNELELIGVNKNGPMRLSVTDLKGVQLQLGSADNGLVYELRVPLHSSPEDPYAINPKGDQIGIGFVGGKFEPRESFARRGGEGGRFGGGEGMPGGEGGEGGEGGGMPGGMEGGGYGGGERDGFHGERGGQFQAPKQIDFWLKVDLAAGPQHAPAIQ